MGLVIVDLNNVSLVMLILTMMILKLQFKLDSCLGVTCINKASYVKKDNQMTIICSIAPARMVILVYVREWEKKRPMSG